MILYVCKYGYISGVPIPIHVQKSSIKGDLSPNFIETSMTFVIELNQISMSSVTEWSISRVLAIAQLVISTF
jgi:hypothetical protein